MCIFAAQKLQDSMKRHIMTLLLGLLVLTRMTGQPSVRLELPNHEQLSSERFTGHTCWTSVTTAYAYAGGDKYIYRLHEDEQAARVSPKSAMLQASRRSATSVAASVRCTVFRPHNLVRRLPQKSCRPTRIPVEMLAGTAGVFPRGYTPRPLHRHWFAGC